MCICVQDYSLVAQAHVTKPDCTIHVKGVTCRLYLGDGIESLAKIIENDTYGMFKNFCQLPYLKLY